MKNIFRTDKRHTVTEANINFYTVPFIHPERTMREHDFIYMLDGEWTFRQNDKVYTVKKGSLLILGANMRHRGLTPCLPNTKTMYFHVSCEDGDYATENEPEITEDEVCIETYSDVGEKTDIRKYFSDLVNAKLQGNQKKADICFDLLLCELSQKQSYIKNENVAVKIQKIIHTNPEKFYGNDELAKLAHVSLKTAENKFKELYGITIHKYILQFKIEQALQYFKNFPDMNIKEVAYNLGFYDEYHFSKQFKKITGVTPKSMRKH